MHAIPPPVTQAAIDPGVVAVRFLLKLVDVIALKIQGAITSGRLNRSERGLLSFCLVVLDQGSDIHIRNAVAVSETEAVAIEIVTHPAEATSRLAEIACIHQRNLPWFTLSMVHLHMVVDVHVERDIAGMEKIVGEVLLDQIAHVAAADDELVDAKVAINLEYVPKNRFATYLHHRLRLKVGFLAEASAKSTG